MTVSRNVIIDLLPLYTADEVSDDTRQLVDAHLATDPQLAKMVERMKAFDSAEIPQTPSHDHEAKTWNRIRELRYQYNTFFVLGLFFSSIFICVSLLSLVANLAGGGLIALLLFVVSGVCWYGMLNTGRAMRAPDL